MKITPVLLSAAVAVGLTSCISIDRTNTPATTVTREVTTTSPATTTVTRGPVVEQRVITTLPRGYTTRTVRGTRYYYYDNVYYRTVPGGYTIIERP